MSAAWQKLSELPLDIDSYELTAHDREFGAFTRGSTVVHLKGGGEEGVGEDVIYTILDHIAHRDPGPVHDFTGVPPFGEFCTLVGSLALFPGAPPGFEPWRHPR